MFRHRPVCVVLSSLLLGLVVSSLTLAQDDAGSEPKKVVVEADGAVEVPAQIVPLSAFLSPEAKAYVAQHLQDMQDPEILKQDSGIN